VGDELAAGGAAQRIAQHSTGIVAGARGKNLMTALPDRAAARLFRWPCRIFPWARHWQIRLSLFGHCRRSWPEFCGLVSNPDVE
jgi:hypothetical protein